MKPKSPRHAPKPKAKPTGDGGQARPSAGHSAYPGPRSNPRPQPANRGERSSSPGHREHAGAAPQGPRAGGRGQGSLEPELHVIGKHAVQAVLEHQPGRAKKLWLAGNPELEVLAKNAGVPVLAADMDTLDGLAGKSASHQGAVLSCGPYPYVDLDDLDEAPSLTLVLDGVEDPRNLGAAARAAFALGATLVVVPRDRAASCTASAHKAAAGALSRIGVAQVNNLKRGLDLLKEKGAWIVGAEADATSAPWDVDLKGKIALVVGGEDRGLRRLTREACDHVVSIPMAEGDTSLNAADAATVLLYETLRQRLAPATRD